MLLVLLLRYSVLGGERVPCTLVARTFLADALKLRLPRAENAQVLAAAAKAPITGRRHHQHAGQICSISAPRPVLTHTTDTRLTHTTAENTLGPRV